MRRSSKLFIWAGSLVILAVLVSLTGTEDYLPPLAAVVAGALAVAGLGFYLWGGVVHDNEQDALSEAQRIEMTDYAMYDADLTASLFDKTPNKNLETCLTKGTRVEVYEPNYNTRTFGTLLESVIRDRYAAALIDADGQGRIRAAGYFNPEEN